MTPESGAIAQFSVNCPLPGTSDSVAAAATVSRWTVTAAVALALSVAV